MQENTGSILLSYRIQNVEDRSCIIEIIEIQRFTDFLIIYMRVLKDAFSLEATKYRMLSQTPPGKNNLLDENAVDNIKVMSGNCINSILDIIEY